MRFNRSFYLVLTGLVLFGSSCKKEMVRTGASTYPTLVLSTTDKTWTTSYSATVCGRQDVKVYAQVSGKITDVKITEGRVVKKGQLLFVIDQVPYRAALRVAEANYAAAEVALAAAQLDYDNTKQLYDNKVVSIYELQAAQNNVLSAKASLAQMEAQKVNAENDLSYTEVKSPSDGVVGTIPYRQGTLVTSTMEEPLTTVSDNSEMYVYFSMNENRLLDMAYEYGTIANALKEMPDVRLKLSNDSLYVYSGRVESISGVINENTGSVSLRAVFPNPDRLLHSGANGSVLIPEEHTGIIVIPQEATFELQDKVFVYKVVDGKTKSTQISVAAINDGKEYVVTAGLQAGDEIIASGAGLLRDGMEVNKASVSEN